ncbi:hypothetical protein ACIPYU_19675 [Paenarthrobacter nicotinovorans]|uniref:hypothetical protein n=1 Tax=Paenarthrobacter nicotinovorans TaxID=29320 RepID=UPI00380B3774
MNVERRNKTLVLSGLLTALALITSGCQVAPNPNRVPESAPNPAAVADKATGLTGTGQKVETATGSYEKTTLAAGDPAYTYNIQAHDASSGWTAEEATAAQKLAVDYLSNEFLDSTALEGSDQDFWDWYYANEGKYFSDKVTGEIRQGQPSQMNIILGNFGTNKLLPSLIHDGSARVKEENLEVQNSSFSITPEQINVVNFNFNWQVGYRVDDANAAALVGHYTNLTGEEVLNSKYAKDNLKDGVGENVYRGKGSAYVAITKDPGGLKIVGFSSKADFDTRDFANQDAD